MRDIRDAKKAKLLITLLTVLLLLLLLGACAPRETTPSGDQGPGTSSPSGETPVVALPEWSTASDCGVCHVTEATSEEDATQLYGFHATHDSASECIDCHDNETALRSLHDGATAESTMPRRLKKTAVLVDETCLGCHEQTELPIATASVNVLTDSNGLTVNPHQLPANSEHDQITCVSCHNVHLPITDVPKMAENTCLSCHHTGVYECANCHNE